jgi:hypothetical protein
MVDMGFLLWRACEKHKFSWRSSDGRGNYGYLGHIHPTQMNGYQFLLIGIV